MSIEGDPGRWWVVDGGRTIAGPYRSFDHALERLEHERAVAAAFEDKRVHEEGH